jgi:hypothetical protein
VVAPLGAEFLLSADSHREKRIKTDVLRINFKYALQFFASVSAMAKELNSSFAKNCESIFLP